MINFNRDNIHTTGFGRSPAAAEDSIIPRVARVAEKGILDRLRLNRSFVQEDMSTFELLLNFVWTPHDSPPAKEHCQQKAQEVINGRLGQQVNGKVLFKETDGVSNVFDKQLAFSRLSRLVAEDLKQFDLKSLKELLEHLEEGGHQFIQSWIKQAIQYKEKEQKVLFFKSLPGAPECKGSIDEQLDILNGWVGTEEATQRFAQIESLDLSGLKLSCLPQEISLFLNLKTLHLENNQLEEIPLVGSLSCLEKLYLQRNLIKSIPVLFTNLQNLEHLDLSENKLQSFPHSIYELKKLKRLKLSYNQITEMRCYSLTNLSSLQVLQLDHNLLKELPRCIVDLKNLTFLYLGHNCLQTMPPLVTQVGENNYIGLTQLITLDLNENQLSELPILTIYDWNFGQTHGLVNLKTIHLNYNRLQFIPKELRAAHLHVKGDVLAQVLHAWMLEIKQYGPSHGLDFTSLTSLPEDKQLELAIYLGRLRELKDYKNGEESRANIVFRVQKMLELACRNKEFREVIFEKLEDGMTDCGDRVLVTFNELEIEWQFLHRKLDRYEFEALAVQEGMYYHLIDYVRNLAGQKLPEARLERMARGEVEENDAEHCWNEEIEVILAFQICCMKGINGLPLPITTQEMLYPGVVKGVVTEEMITEAKATIRNLTHQELLMKSKHWQAHIHEQHALAVQKINEKYTDWDLWAQEYDEANKETREGLLQEHSVEEGYLAFHNAIIAPGFKGYLAATETILQRRGEEMSKLDFSTF